MKGTLSTVGCAMLNEPLDNDAVCLKPILEAGAIPLVKGNVPQAALSIHSENLVWGTAQNVFDQSRSCGGSSGGDGGLVSSKCVPIAIGSDVGGSLRIPATFNGLYTLKPTQGRISYKGGMDARLIGGNQALGGHLKAVTGPLAHSVSDVLEFFKIQCMPDQHL